MTSEPAEADNAPLARDSTGAAADDGELDSVDDDGPSTRPAPLDGAETASSIDATPDEHELLARDAASARCPSADSKTSWALGDTAGRTDASVGDAPAGIG